MESFGGAKLILFLGPRMVVLRRDHTPGIPWPGMLDLPGGARDGSETAEACVLRETEEEIGLRLTAGDLVWRCRHGQGVFFAAHRAAQEAEAIVFGSEGLGWDLMIPEVYLGHPDTIPHHKDVVSDYLAFDAGRFG